MAPPIMFRLSMALLLTIVIIVLLLGRRWETVWKLRVRLLCPLALVTCMKLRSICLGGPTRCYRSLTNSLLECLMTEYIMAAGQL